MTNVARKNNLGALAHSADNGLHLMRRKILRLVNNNKLMRNTAAADLGERLHDQFTASHKLIHALFGGLAVGFIATAASG